MACRYPGVVAGRPQVAPRSKHPGIARQSQSPRRPMPHPSKHPGAARRGRSRKARKLSPIYATENVERVGGKPENTKDCKLHGKALHAQIRWMREKRKEEGKVRMRLTLKNTACRATTDCQCHIPTVTAILSTRHSPTPALAESHPRKRR